MYINRNRSASLAVPVGISYVCRVVWGMANLLVVDRFGWLL